MDFASLALLSLFFGVLFGILSAVIASNKGQEPIPMFFAGLLLGPIGLIIAIILPHESMASKAPVEAAPANSPADEFGKLADLHARGALSDDEFAAAKASLLAKIR